jgi:hypothetical protein
MEFPRSPRFRCGKIAVVKLWNSKTTCQSFRDRSFNIPRSAPARSEVLSTAEAVAHLADEDEWEAKKQHTDSEGPP